MHTEYEDNSGEAATEVISEPLGWRTLLKWTLYFLAIVLPLAFYLRTYDSAMVKISVLQLGTLAAAAVWIIGGIGEGRFEIPWRAVPFTLPAALLFSWNALRFAFSEYRLASLQGFLLQEIFLLTFILTVLLFSRADMRRAVLMVLGAWAVTVLYGMLQYLGMDPFIWRGAFGDRVFSTLANPTLFAAYLVICVPLAVSLASEEREPLWLRVTSGVLAVAGAFLLQRTGDTAAVLAFYLGLGIIFLMSWRRFDRGRSIPFLLLAGACALVALAPLSGPVPSPANNRHYAFLSETWKGTKELIKTRPFFGSGPGSFWVRYPAFRRQGVFAIEKRHNNQTDHPENELLEQWADGGGVGVILWCWLFAGLLARSVIVLFRKDPMEDGVYGIGLLAAVCGGLALALVSNATRFPAPGWLVYFAAGLLAVLVAERRPDAGKVAALPVPLARSRQILALPVLAAAGLLAYGSVQAFRSDLWHNMAVFYSKSGQWDAALAAYDKEVPWSGTYIMSRYFMGNVCLDQDSPDPERALEYYRQVRSLAPDYVQVHYREALALKKLGRYTESAESLERQVRLDPVWPDAWKELALVYEAVGELEKAAVASGKAPEL